MGETKRKIKPLSIVCFVLAALLAAAAIYFMFFGNMPAKGEEQKEPIDIYTATGQDEYAYLNLQYMSESIACLEAVESMQYYITFDSEWNSSVICLYDSELEAYRPYIDWFYTEETEGGPEETRVTGYSVPYDDDLRQFVIECYNEMFGIELVNKQNFAEVFGTCYLVTGQSSDAYKTFNIGIYCLLGMVIFVIVGVGASYRSLQTMEEGSMESCLEVRKTYKGRGVIGALLGALLGGVLWTVVGALGYISGWIGVLTVLFATIGYKLFAKEESGFGTVISVIFSLIMVFPATYLASVWSFYQELNASISEYVTLARAFVEFPKFLSNTGSWGSMTYNIALGYVFMFIAGAYSISGVLKRKKQEKAMAEQMTDVTAEMPEE